MCPSWLRSSLMLAALAAPVLSACGPSFRLPPPPAAAELPRLEARVAAAPSDPELAVRLAHGYYAAGRLEEARPLLERATTQRPGDATAAFLLGVTYEDLGEFADARRLYRAYIDAGPPTPLRRELANRLPLLQRRELQALVRASLAREAELANTPPQPWTVAVFPFEFVGGDPQFRPLGRALAEMLVTDLAQTSRLRVLERSQVQYLLDEMQLSASGRIDPATAVRSGRVLGAERVIQGSIDGSAAALQLESTIVRVSDNVWPGETRDAARPNQLSLTESAQIAALFDMQTRLALRIFSSLGIELTAAERERITRRPTENLMAILAYGRGLEANDAGDFLTAAAHFAEAARLDPSFAEASQQASNASAQASSSTVATNDLVGQATADASVALGSDAFFLPDPITRDPAAEILRTEGVGSATILEIIIRRQ
jgi:tetratricopeptide (TPR) repeat protein